MIVAGDRSVLLNRGCDAVATGWLLLLQFAGVWPLDDI